LRGAPLKRRKDRIIEPDAATTCAVHSANPRKNNHELDAFDFFPNCWHFRNSIIH